MTRDARMATAPPVDYLQVASELARAHAHLLSSEPPSVETILIRAGRCPVCAAPLLQEGRACVCSSCRQQVIR